MHKKEILKLNQEINIKGFTLIPLSFYMNKRGYTMQQNLSCWPYCSKAIQIQMVCMCHAAVLLCSVFMSNIELPIYELSR